MPKTIVGTVVGFLFTMITHPARGGTVYVDKSFSPCDQSDGSQRAPYCSIQEAIDDFNSDTVVVYPGVYTENIRVTKDLAILGYDGPHTTAVDGSAGGGTTATFTLVQGITARLEGLKISSGYTGIWVGDNTTLRLYNCVICGNASHGLFIKNDDSTHTRVPRAIVYNCAFVANGGSGVYLDMWWSRDDAYPPYLSMRNTLLISNGAYGIGVDAGGNPYKAPERIVLDYNNSFGNSGGPYAPTAFCAGRAYSCGGHSISVAPEFVGGTGPVCNKDFRLVPTSPCVDSGDPGIGWLDPDGTRSDIGAYGGPGARRFYTNPNDGPIVRRLELPQGMVPHGETFTIRATGAVREQAP